MKGSGWSAAAVLLAAWLAGTSPPLRAAGLIEVDQTIFGMDCAPCAYGVERGLKALPGAQTVTVSLNRGKAVVRFAPDSPVDLADVRDAIRKNGFTPKEATVRVTGRLVRIGGELRLQAGKTNFLLMPATEADTVWNRLRQLPDGIVLELTALAPGQPTELLVTGFVHTDRSSQG
jgi:copper chaperone CopZ